MPYSSPNCSDLNFELKGVYTPPNCSDLNFNLGGDIGIINSNIIINVFSDTFQFFNGDVILSDNININIYSDIFDVEEMIDVQSSVLSINNNFDIFDVKNTEDNDLPINLSKGGRSYVWSTPEIVDTEYTFPWNEAKHIIKENSISYKQQVLLNITIHFPWKNHYIADIESSLVWKDFSNFDNEYCSGFSGKMQYSDIESSISYDEFSLYDNDTCSGYFIPGENDKSLRSIWDKFDESSLSFHTVWNAPESNDIHKFIPWGPYSYYLLCYADSYKSPRCGKLDFHFPSKYPLIGDVCQGITFKMSKYSSSMNDPRCPYQHVHSGIRDTYNTIQVPDFRFPIPQKVYYMFNYIFVKELITNTPIEVFSVEATIDSSSWLWQFKIVVTSSDCLEILKPVNGVFSNIEININGYKWIATIESWSENRAFGNDSWTLQGRSPSLLFAAPVNEKKSGSESTALQGRTIFDNIVDNVHIPTNWPSRLSDWSTDWSAYDNTCTGFAPHSSWYMPENTLTYSDKTDIEILQSLTDSIGAYIQTEANSDGSNCKLVVKPIFSHMPWDWNSTNNNIEWKPLIEDQCKEISRSNKLYPSYQAIHVFGENIGGSNDGTGPDGTNTAIFVDICRDGWCGSGTANYAPMISNSLVVSSKSGLELGRMILGRTGEWIHHTLRLNVLCPNSVSSGLFLPGDMITVLERGNPWYGQVTSVTVSGAVTSGLVGINQQISVDEYRGN